MILRRNKKADLLENALTLIIAVVGLAIIFYAGWQLYSVYVNQDETNAKTAINTIEGRINLLEDGQLGKVVVKQISGWFIAGWGKNDAGRPDKCYFKSCLCICKDSVSSNIEDCQTNGFCRLFDVEDVNVNANVMQVEVIAAGESAIATESCGSQDLIPLKEEKGALLEIPVKKDKDKIEINYISPRCA